MTTTGYFTRSAFGDVKVLQNGISGGTFTGGPGKFVIHTTEGGSLPDYRGGTIAPHVTLRFLGTAGDCEIFSHTPLGVAARALRNEPGGVQTNRDSAIQMEIIGSSVASHASKYGILYVPGINDKMKRTLAGVIKEICVLRGISTRLTDKAWPVYNGGEHGQRMSLSVWDNFSGICGHEHVPENDHLDPASLDLHGYFDLAPVPVPPVPVPAERVVFPLPKGHYFGPDNLANAHSGYHSATDRNGLRTYQAKMRKRGWKIGVDGLYGPETKDVTTKFQKEKHLGVDGLIGRETWDAAWTEPIT